MDIWIAMAVVVCSKLLLLQFFRQEKLHVWLTGALLGLFCFSLFALAEETFYNRYYVWITGLLLLAIEAVGYRLFLKGSWQRSATAALATNLLAFIISALILWIRNKYF